MLITREIDYAIRTIRVLYKNEHLNVKQICDMEVIPIQFAYKILKKLSVYHILESTRGAGGGYRLIQSPDTLTLYDILMAVNDNDEFNGMNECLNSDYDCVNNSSDKICKVNKELTRINGILEQELKRHTIKEILTKE